MKAFDWNQSYCRKHSSGKVPYLRHLILNLTKPSCVPSQHGITDLFSPLHLRRSNNSANKKSTVLSAATVLFLCAAWYEEPFS